MSSSKGEAKRDSLYKLFMRLDTDKSGKLSRGELQPISKRKPKIFKMMDADNSGDITFKEFARYMSK